MRARERVCVRALVRSFLSFSGVSRRDRDLPLFRHFQSFDSAIYSAFEIIFSLSFSSSSRSLVRALVRSLARSLVRSFVRWFVSRRGRNGTVVRISLVHRYGNFPFGA